PKDMKTPEIRDTVDHISLAATQRSPAKIIPSPVVLVVVRGMILAHSFPVAITRVPVTINQDMKALRPRDRVTAEFLAFMLKGATALLLSRVEVAAHGTRRLRTEKLTSLPIPVPPPDTQQKIVDKLLEAQSTADSAFMQLAENQTGDIKESILRQAL